MKTRTIIILLVLAAFVAVLLVDLLGSASRFADVATARSSGETVHLIGKWVRRDESVFDAARSFNKFYIEDSLNQVAEIEYYHALAGDMGAADKLDVVCRYDKEKGVFVAEKIHMKCPSKYNEGQAPKMN